MKYNKEDWELLKRLFDSNDRKNQSIHEIIATINDECLSTLKKWEEVINLCRAFSDKNSAIWNVIEILSNQYDTLRKGESKPIELSVATSYKPLFQLRPSIFEFFNLKIFKDGVKLTNMMTVDQVCTALNDSMREMCSYIQYFLDSWREDKIRVQDITVLAQKIGSFNQMNELLKLLEKEGLANPKR